MKKRMVFCDVIQLEMPESFPLKEYETFVGAVRAATPSGSNSRKEFNGASNLIGWRYRACAEYKDSYLASWRATGAAASFEELYSREKHFFGMFVCALSCIESACYACYALASHHTILGLPFDEKIRRHESSPRHLKDKLEKVAPQFPLTQALKKRLSEPQWDILKTYRNTMTHRSNIPRINYVSVGSAPSPEKAMEFAETWSTKALSADENEFDNIFLWITEFLKEILHGGSEMANAIN